MLVRGSKLDNLPTGILGLVKSIRVASWIYPCCTIFRSQPRLPRAVVSALGSGSDPTRALCRMKYEQEPPHCRPRHVLLVISRYEARVSDSLGRFGGFQRCRCAIDSKTTGESFPGATSCRLSPCLGTEGFLGSSSPLQMCRLLVPCIIRIIITVPFFSAVHTTWSLVLAQRKRIARHVEYFLHQ